MREEVQLQMNDEIGNVGKASIRVTRYVFCLPWVVTVGAVGGLLVVSPPNIPWWLMGVVGFLIAGAVGRIEQDGNPDGLLIDAPTNRGPNEQLFVKDDWRTMKRFVDQAANKNMMVLLERKPECLATWTLVAKRMLEDAVVEFAERPSDSHRMIAERGCPVRWIEGDTRERLDDKARTLTRRGWERVGEPHRKKKGRKSVYAQQMGLKD